MLALIPVPNAGVGIFSVSTGVGISAGFSNGININADVMIGSIITAAISSMLVLE